MKHIVCFLYFSLKFEAVNEYLQSSPVGELPVRPGETLLVLKIKRARLTVRMGSSNSSAKSAEEGPRGSLGPLISTSPFLLGNTFNYII